MDQDFTQLFSGILSGDGSRTSKEPIRLHVFMGDTGDTVYHEILQIYYRYLQIDVNAGTLLILVHC